ncbi:MAG: ribosomal-processing cysteine protease Prp [Clostridia bacterium]|nr:ribosomal-processing cysteine protease Prp [Clostridia bacterium]
MTRCTLFVDSFSRITGFSVKGHSGYAEEGSDIVCAGISALVITTENALCQLVKLSPAERGGEDGFVEVMLPDQMTEKQMHDAQLLLSALHIGLENIAQAYPDYVRLTTRRVR